MKLLGDPGVRLNHPKARGPSLTKLNVKLSFKTPASGLGCKSSTNSLACSWHIRRSCHTDKAKLYWHHSKLRHTYNHSAVGSKQSKVHHWPSFPHIFQFAFHMHKEPERKLMSHEVSLLTNLNSLPPQIASESFTPGSNVYALACHDSPDVETMNTSHSFRVQRSQDELGSGKHGHTAHSLLMIGHLSKM